MSERTIASGMRVDNWRAEREVTPPFQQPTTYQLTINPKTAKALGLDIPAQVLALADEVIE